MHLLLLFGHLVPLQAGNNPHDHESFVKFTVNVYLYFFLNLFCVYFALSEENSEC